jgi:hypothetical protein
MAIHDGQLGLTSSAQFLSSRIVSGQQSLLDFAKSSGIRDRRAV